MKTIIKSRKPFFPSCIMVLGTLASPECGACGDTASGFTYTLLLLHGLPSSSRIFEPLFDRLADRYHLIAPDYPGFGHSDWPNPKEFAYTFDRYAEIMARFTEALAIPRYTLYMQDYGGPVGFRMALTHPERVQALIVQDAVAHNEGLGANWKTRRAFWADRKANESALRTNLLSLPATRTRHLGNDPNVERYDPDLWTDEFAFLSQPGQIDIQTELFYDYRSNVQSYPKWQAWMRERQPRLLVIWGKYDLSFDPSEPEAYRRDVHNAEVHGSRTPTLRPQMILAASPAQMSNANSNDVIETNF